MKRNMQAEIYEEEIFSRDPICGMPLVEKETEFKVAVRGRTYHFCNEYCMHVFFGRRESSVFFHGNWVE